MWLNTNDLVFFFLLKDFLLKYKHHGIVMEQNYSLKINIKKVLEKLIFAVYFHEQSISLLMENNAMKFSISELAQSNLEMNLELHAS